MNTELSIPIVAINGMTELKLDLTGILRAESRANEIAVVNSHKAPELLAVFNRAYLDVSNVLSQVRLHQARAENELNKIKAIILVDKIPATLKEKGLSSSADIRQALIELDPEYQQIRDKLDLLNATVEYLKGKMKFMENAYTSVKKIMGENAYNHEARLDGMVNGKMFGNPSED